MTLRIDFKGIAGNGTPLHSVPPRQSLSAPEWGWMHWTFAWPGVEETVSISYTNRIADFWVWAAAVAHRLLPVTLWVDEEGSMTALCVDWHSEANDTVCITLRKHDPDDDEVEYRRRTWLDKRGRWLRRMGHVFHARMGSAFMSRHWGYASPLWLPVECCLPWHWPGQVAVQGLSSPFKPAQQRVRFFLALAQALGVEASDSIAVAGLVGEFRARLQFQKMLLRHDALMLAYRHMGVEASTDLVAIYRRGVGELCEAFADTDAVFDGQHWESVQDAATHWAGWQARMNDAPRD